MAPRPCPRCACPVSDLAPRCPLCGADLAPAADDATQALPTAPARRAALAPVSGTMRNMQVLAVLLCIAGGIAETDWSSAVAAEGTSGALGRVIGASIAPLIVGALFLAWSRAFRRYVPFVAGSIVIMSAVTGAVTEREEEVDRELAQTRGMMTAFSDSAGRSVGDSASSAPPKSQEAKLLWAANRAFAELPAYRREVARRHGIDPDKMPEAWITARYIASATAHPGVERYWRGYQKYTREYESGIPGFIESRVAAHGREAGIDPEELRSFLKGMRRGMARRGASEPAAWADSAASAALAYHRFLVSVDARVSYDAARDRAGFDRETDLARAGVLEDRFIQAAERLHRAQQAARTRGMQKLDSLPAYFN